jgi:FKBP-type peptidyl-prolyl cis-trans isomerase FkpA
VSGRYLQARAHCARLAIIFTVAGASSLAMPALAAQAVPDPAVAFLAKNRSGAGVVETASGLQYKVLTPGRGDARPTDEDVALINYEGKLSNGTSFDKSQQPTPMPVVAADEATGRQGVIPGFSEGLKLMPRGAKYRFWIKPALGYGGEASGPIPANSVLVFDVEMLDFLPEATVRQMMEQPSQVTAGTAPPQP